MHVSEIGTHPRRSPGLNGPSAEPLLPGGVSDELGVIHLEIPPGSGLPEHDHGASQIVLIPLSGVLELRQGEQRCPISHGMAAYFGAGEKVAVANPGDGPASVILVASPPQYVHRVAATWGPAGEDRVSR